MKRQRNQPRSRRVTLSPAQAREIAERVAVMIARYVTPDSDSTPRKRGRPNRRKLQLRINAQLEAMRMKAKATYHWNPRELIRSLLRKDPELAPEQRRASHAAPDRTAYSNYRRWLPNADKEERQWIADRKERCAAFVASLDDAELQSFFEVVSALTDPESFFEWLAAAAEQLPASTFERLVVSCTSPKMREIIAGLHLQEQAESSRKPYHLPG